MLLVALKFHVAITTVEPKFEWKQTKTQISLHVFYDFYFISATLQFENHLIRFADLQNKVIQNI